MAQILGPMVYADCYNKRGLALTAGELDRLVGLDLIHYCSECSTVRWTPREPPSDVYHLASDARFCTSCLLVFRETDLVGTICMACINLPRPIFIRPYQAMPEP